jgi:transglutaminase-like putative cysteine protease
VRPIAGVLATVTGVAALFGAAGADTLYIDGRMAGRVTLEIAERYEPGATMEWLRLKSFRTPSFVSPAWKQTIVSDDVTYTSRPSRVDVTPDSAGNQVLVERWERPRTTVELLRRVVVDIEAGLAPVASQAAFPPGAPPADAARYLAATRDVQKDDPRIQAEARRLTAGATSQHQAVTALLNFVTDRLTWKLEPPGHDAITGLTGGIVNCQGYSHLSIALLRAVGIPARVAVGITLSKGWQVPTDGGPLVLKSGTGRHAWIEVFYPDIGWAPFDPQSTHLFVSLYHIRQAVGLDVDEAATIISGAPALPAMHETIRGAGAGEAFNVRMVSRVATPRNFIVASRVRTPAGIAPPVVPPVVPPPVAPPAPAPALLRRQDFTRPIEFGNLDFPASLRILSAPRPSSATGGVEAGRTFVVETADYATGTDELAQAFTIDRPLLLSDVALALQKFGGTSGELWLDLREDRGRRPGPRLAESARLNVGQLIGRAGYRWVAFPFAPERGGMLLQPGRYWTVLRSAGDGIFNWYFSLGNTFGEPDDSRTGPRGVNDWPAVLNYRFNFRVSGLVKP